MFQTDGAHQVAIQFLKIIGAHGIPKNIVSDRDGRFIPAFWKTLFERHGTKLQMPTAFHPETDGQTERMNRPLEQVLRSYIFYNQEDWSEWLPIVESTMNNTVSASTGHTPFFANYGYHPRMITTLDTREEDPVTASAFQSRMLDIEEKIKENLAQAQERMAEYANCRRTPLELKEGDMVLVKTKNLQIHRPSRKLGHTHEGPFKVLRKIGRVAYLLELPESWTVHPVFHVSLLEPYKNPNNRNLGFQDREEAPPAPTNVGGIEQFRVDKIIAKNLERTPMEIFCQMDRIRCSP